jgi:hypothetical protein
MQMTEPMNEERARLLCSPGRVIELNAKPRHEPALDEFLIAKGYLERVEQEKRWCDCHAWPTMSEFHEYTVALERRLHNVGKALKAADRMADYLEDDPHLNKNSFLLAYRAARAKLDKGEPGK